MFDMPSTLAQSALDSAPIALVVIDAFDSIWFANRRLYELFGYSHPDIIGESIDKLVPGRTLGVSAMNPDGGQRPLPLGLGVHLVARHRDRSEFPIEFRVHPVECRESILFIAAIQEVSERSPMQAELELPRSAADVRKDG